MGRDFFEQFSIAKEVFQEADRILGEPFSKLIFEGLSDELTLTKNSQLAIFITSYAILRVVQENFPEMKPTICAGLSLGEYTALVAAGVLSFEEALLLVKARGSHMQEACQTHPGTMSVVLGLELDQVKAVVDAIEGVWIANLNCPGQIVISGTEEGVAEAALQLKEQGARRVMPLEVSGAFHSGLMQSAQDQLEPLIQKAVLLGSEAEVVMNVPGAPVLETDAMRENMIAQVTEPVLWQKGIESMLEKGIDLFIEMGPGKTLAGMNKRIKVLVPTYSVENKEDLTLLKGERDAIAQR